MADLKKDSINAAVRDSSGDGSQVKKLKELQIDNEQLESKYKSLEDQLDVINQNAIKRQQEFERQILNLNQEKADLKCKIGELKSSEIQTKNEVKNLEGTLREETVAFKRKENQLDQQLKQFRE